LFFNGGGKGISNNLSQLHPLQETFLFPYKSDKSVIALEIIKLIVTCIFQLSELGHPNQTQISLHVIAMYFLKIEVEDRRMTGSQI
jgi:hypothetical protein